MNIIEGKPLEAYVAQDVCVHHAHGGNSRCKHTRHNAKRSNNNHHCTAYQCTGYPRASWH
jgi:hypothetical protein